MWVTRGPGNTAPSAPCAASASMSCRDLFLKRVLRSQLSDFSLTIYSRKKHKVSSQCCMISGDPARVQHKGPGKPGEKSAHRFWLRCLNADSGMFLHGQATSPGFRASSRAGIRETSSSKQQSKMVQNGLAWLCCNIWQFCDQVEAQKRWRKWKRPVCQPI